MGSGWAARPGASLNACHIPGCQHKEQDIAALLRLLENWGEGTTGTRTTVTAQPAAWTSTSHMCSFQKPPKWSPLKLMWVEDQDPLWVPPELSRTERGHAPAYP